jgi:hypothetical protein
MGREGRGYKRLVILGLALAALTVAVLITISPLLGVDWVPLATAVVSLFLAFLMLIAVYVAVDQLRISVESSERVTDKLFKVSEKIDKSNRELAGVSKSLEMVCDLMAEEAGKAPRLDVCFVNLSDRLKISQGEKVLPVKFSNAGNMNCRGTRCDLYFPRGIEVKPGELYGQRMGHYDNYAGTHVAVIDLDNFAAGYRTDRHINVVIPSDMVGEQEIECVLLGENCPRTDKMLTLEIIP